MSRFRCGHFDMLVFLVFVSLSQCYQCLFIEDFRNSATSNWKEFSDSDTHRDGQSVSSFVTGSFKEGQNAILFTLLVPCEHKGAFAGILKRTSLDISNASRVTLKLRGQGNYRGYEFVLRHNGDFGDSIASYVTYFQAPETLGEITLPIDGFRAYKQGKLIPGYKLLNKQNITALGILAYGGSHRPEKQSGVAALEIEWISIE